jgi:hypothetical protein
MNDFGRRFFAASPRGGWFSPRYFLLRALMLGALFLIVHLAGLREYTAFLSGTPGAVGADMRTSALYGTIYIFFYFGAVLVAPTLVLAAGIVWGWQRFRKG